MINETINKNIICAITDKRIKTILKSKIKLFISFALDIIYNIILHLSNERKNLSQDKKKKKYYISICTVFKDEAKFLKEWIDFHQMLGVDHFYLYNNFSSDNYLEILSTYINNGIVTLIDWPYEKAQIQAFEDCYNKCKNETYWLTFIDVDEFFCPFYSDNLKEWISKFEKYPSILIYWKMFGTSGKFVHDNNKYVIEQYTHSWEKCYNIGKQILNTSYIPVNIYHHYIYVYAQILGVKFKIPSMNEFGHFITYPNTNIVNKNYSIQLYHYWSKAYDEYISKRNKGDVFYGKDALTRTFVIFMNFEKRNKTIDVKINRFLIRFKLYVKNKDQAII